MLPEIEFEATSHRDECHTRDPSSVHHDEVEGSLEPPEEIPMKLRKTFLKQATGMNLKQWIKKVQGTTMKLKKQTEMKEMITSMTFKHWPRNQNM